MINFRMFNVVIKKMSSQLSPNACVCISVMVIKLFVSTNEKCIDL